MKSFLEKHFKLSQFHTNVKTELLAGLTTFVTMAYVLATIPNMLAGAGLDKHVMLTVMIMLIIFTSCAMASTPTARSLWLPVLAVWVSVFSLPFWVPKAAA